MSDGIAAIQARVTALQSRLAELGSAGGSSGRQFAARLADARAQQPGGTAAAPAVPAAPAAPAAPAVSASGAASAPASAGTAAAREPSKVLGGGDRITGTLRAAIEEVDRRFGGFSAIGAWRADGGVPGSDHPTGKAADFMITSGGKMPSAARLKEGWEIANYLKDNADRLGVKYVIFAQHIWNPSRAGEGWRLMEDRGGVTANHFDHVHLSVER
ncbi:hypothetical protein GCM10010466_46100 [Planomonospora alba]|uniref:ARB-07466-like C-terminal domain-containing protein n=1 Tax=Planomonospora alba TaxID=161354 RepID=A0ABP6NNU4_9ACTN